MTITVLGSSFDGDDKQGFLSRLFQQIPIGAVWARASSGIHVNREGARILGLPCEQEYELQRIDDYFALADGKGRSLPLASTPLARALGGDSVPRTTLQVVRKDGTRQDVSMQAFPLELEDGACAVALFEDSSSSVDRSWEPWLDVLAHEVGSSLSCLRLHLDMLRGHLTSGDRGAFERHLAAVDRSVVMVDRLVAGFLDSARARSSFLDCQPGEVELNRFLEAFGSSNVLAPHHRLSLSLEPALKVRADSQRLEQILINLLSNARKYSVPGALEIGARACGEHVIISLKDEGPGIPRSQQHLLFRCYSRLPSNQEGSGIGLWLARQAARQMDGDLWFTSCENAPTTFYLQIPRLC